MNDSKRNLRAQRALMRKFKGSSGGLCFEFDHNRRVAHFAIHDGDMHGSSLTFDKQQADDLVEKILREMRRPEALTTIQNIVRDATWEKDREIERLNGDVQTLRFRILHLEREAEAPAPYRDNTALALASGKERAA